MAALTFDSVTRSISVPPRLGAHDELRERLAFIPERMASARRWLLWTPDKVPHYVNGTKRNGKLDSPADVASLATLEAALDALERDSRFAGLGFALGFDPDAGAYWQGLDLDNALAGNDYTTGRARELYDATEGYAERSPSEKGFHVIGLGQPFRAVKWKRDGDQAIEAYSAARFFTVTGRMMRDGGLDDLAPLVERVRAELVAAGVPRERKARTAAGDAVAYLDRQSPDMQAWLKANPIETALAACGFARIGDRYLSPASTSGVPGVLVLDELRAVTFHASDAGTGTACEGDGEVFNAFDLAAKFKFGGDRKAAARTLLAQGTPPPMRQEAAAGEAQDEEGEDVSQQWREPGNVFREAPAPRFALDDVPAPIARMARAFHEATGFDQSGAIVAAVTAAAAVIDDRYRLAVRPASEWFVSARLWSVLIGTPSAGKSPTICAATDPIKHMHSQAFAQWMKENEDKKPDQRDPMPCMFTSDSTVEALADILRDNPRGLLMLTEEFASWIGGIDAYRDGAGAKNRGEWLQLYDGGPHQIHRIKRGSSFVPNWGCSVLAACTPAGLRDQLRKLPDDGLIQRFIPCILAAPVPPAGGSARDALAEWERHLRAAFTATTCSENRAALRISTSARMTFDTEVERIRTAGDSLYDLSPELASHVGKHPGMLARVALAFHVIDGRQGDAIERDTIEQAVRFMRTVLRHAFALYLGLLTSSQSFEVARAVARSLVADARRPEKVGRDYMTQACRPFRAADDGTRRLAVQALEDAEWLKPVPGSRAYGGWGASEWAVNPRAFDQFADQGAAHRARRDAVRALLAGGHDGA